MASVTPTELPGVGLHQASSNACVLLISSFTAAQEALRTIGLEISVLHPSSLHFASGQEALQRHAAFKYSLVWVDTPGTALSRAPDSQTRFWTAIVRWARQSHSLRIPMYICGPRSKLWTDDRARALLADGIMHECTHRLCHYGLTLQADTGRPSGASYTVYSTYPSVSSPCKCALGTKHATDWQSSLAHRGAARATIMRKFYEGLVATLDIRQVSVCTRVHTTVHRL